jgi:hypothetical protein
VKRPRDAVPDTAASPMPGNRVYCTLVVARQRTVRETRPDSQPSGSTTVTCSRAVTISVAR